MTGPTYVLAVDCGTHAVRSTLYDIVDGRELPCGEGALPLLTPNPGWVEIDSRVIAAKALEVVRMAVDRASETGGSIAGIGLTNMRETAIAWDRVTGEPLGNGVMWMSQQSSEIVERWRAAGYDSMLRARTGLQNHSFFFASKVAWILENTETARSARDRGRLAVGTVDSWLLSTLTGGGRHATDASNASRTMVFDLASADWDPELCSLLGIPMDALPELHGTSSEFGTSSAAISGVAAPITGMIADQQASLLGHGCLRPGAAKVTLGTSGVVAVNQGAQPRLIAGLVTSVAWRTDSEVTYEGEGSAFHSGYSVKWLHEQIGLASNGAEPIEKSLHDAQDRVYLLPSFTELGAPRWPQGRGAILAGLRMETNARDILRAAYESMAFQAYDLYARLAEGAQAEDLRIDGGGASNDYVCQLLADLAGVVVMRPASRELTSLGAATAALVGLGADPEPLAAVRSARQSVFLPSDGGYARAGYDHWVELVDDYLSDRG